MTVELSAGPPDWRRVEIRFGAGDVLRGDPVVYARRSGVAATFAVAKARVRPLLDAVR